MMEGAQMHEQMEWKAQECGYSQYTLGGGVIWEKRKNTVKNGVLLGTPTSSMYR